MIHDEAQSVETVDVEAETDSHGVHVEADAAQFNDADSYADDDGEGAVEEPLLDVVQPDLHMTSGRVGAPTVGLQSLPVTGEPRVDDALARLTDLAALPVDEHVGVFEDVQRRLHDTLADLSGQ